MNKKLPAITNTVIAGVYKPFAGRVTFISRSQMSLHILSDQITLAHICVKVETGICSLNNTPGSLFVILIGEQDKSDIISLAVAYLADSGTSQGVNIAKASGADVTKQSIFQSAK